MLFLTVDATDNPRARVVQVAVVDLQSSAVVLRFLLVVHRHRSQSQRG